MGSIETQPMWMDKEPGGEIVHRRVPQCLESAEAGTRAAAIGGACLFFLPILCSETIYRGIYSVLN